MPTYFIVRATVADPAKRAAFDKWYEQEHVPDAVKTFGAQKAWRFWSESDPAAPGFACRCSVLRRSGTGCVLQLPPSHA